MFSLIFINFAIANDLMQMKSVEYQNKPIYESLKELAESETYSKIKLPFNETCQRAVKPCSAVACSVKETSFNGQKGYIDLLCTPESYSKDAAKTGPDVWKDIYKVIENEQMLQNLVSGLRFSINTHIAAFHSMIFNYFISNPRHFQKRYKKEYQENFQQLYSVLRTAVANLINNSSDIDPEVLKLSKKIIEYNTEVLSKTHNTETNMPTIQLHNISISENINIDGIFIDPKTITSINNMIRSLACLGCQKCRLWGTIQLRGLRAAVRSLNGMHVTKMDVICLINAFRRVSVTVEESKRLNAFMFPILHLIIVYYYEILLIGLSILGIMLFFLRSSKKQKIV